MKYIKVDFENERFWIEIGEDDYALRQIIKDDENIYHFSCMEDCLAEGVIQEQDLEGDIKIITKDEFEVEWSNLNLWYNDIWRNIKTSNQIGKKIIGIYKYYYPQGYIFDIGGWLGILRNSNINNRLPILKVGQSIHGVVIDYDDTNMWLVMELTI